MVSRPLEITQIVSLTISLFVCRRYGWVFLNLREIGDMDEGVVEGCEDACDAEDEFAWRRETQLAIFVPTAHKWMRWFLDLPSRT